MALTAKSVALDITDNHGSISYIGIRSIDFYLDGSKIDIGFYEIYDHSGPYYSYLYGVDNLFRTDYSKTGAWWHTSWMDEVQEYVTKEVRIICVFRSPIEFNEIRVCNNHSSGSSINTGAKNVKMTVSESIITDLTYNAEISDGIVAFDGVFREHAATNTADEEIFTINDPPVAIACEPAEIQISGGVHGIFFDGSYYVGTPTAGISIGATCNPFAKISVPPAILTLDADIQLAKCTAYLSPANITLSGQPTTQYEFSTSNTETRFIFTLTGSNDGIGDIEIPISSFQATMNAGASTYLSIVVPGTGSAGDIADRPNGELRIDVSYEQNGVSVKRKKIIETSFDSIRIDEGSTNKSISLSGYKTESVSGDAISLSGSIYRRVSDGEVTHRLAEPNMLLRPGDNVTIGTDTFTASRISYAVSAEIKTFEVSG